MSLKNYKRKSVSVSLPDVGEVVLRELSLGELGQWQGGKYEGAEAVARLVALCVSGEEITSEDILALPASAVNSLSEACLDLNGMRAGLDDREKKG